MSKTPKTVSIQIDMEVWAELQAHASDLDMEFSTPNAVLRKLLDLDEETNDEDARVPFGYLQ